MASFNSDCKVVSQLEWPTKYLSGQNPGDIDLGDSDSFVICAPPVIQPAPDLSYDDLFPDSDSERAAINVNNYTEIKLVNSEDPLLIILRYMMIIKIIPLLIVQRQLFPIHQSQVQLICLIFQIEL